MKAIIPVAGAGTKLRPHTYTQPKALIPLAGKTILSFIIDQLAAAGIREFVFVIGYLGEKIKDYVEDKYPDLQFEFVEQKNRLGIGHAISLTRPVIDEEEPLLIVLGDTICDFDIETVIDSPLSTLGVKKVEDPRSFGIAELNEDGKVVALVEKPRIPKSNMALVGLYKINETKMMFDVMDEHIAKGVVEENAYSLTDALQEMVDKGVEFDTFKVQQWFDCGRKETLLETNATLLKKVVAITDQYPQFENTIIVPPVSITEGCVIANSIIGPNVTIGESTTVHSSIIRDSIIGSFAKLDEVVLHDSLIGSDAYVHGFRQSLNIGDNTEIDLG